MTETELKKTDARQIKVATPTEIPHPRLTLDPNPPSPHSPHLAGQTLETLEVLCSEFTLYSSPSH